jgi:hypothetical protein
MDYVAAAVQNPPCPMCQKPLTIDFTSTKAIKNSSHDILKKSKGMKSSSILNRIDLKQFQTSTKIEALVSFSEIFCRTVCGFVAFFVTSHSLPGCQCEE